MGGRTRKTEEDRQGEARKKHGNPIMFCYTGILGQERTEKDIGSIERVFIAIKDLFDRLTHSCFIPVDLGGVYVAVGIFNQMDKTVLTRIVPVACIECLKHRRLSIEIFVHAETQEWDAVA